jgi:Ser/Thr protein kinase RdoA (MazF antagonist)
MIPYANTAHRPQWADLPADLRTAVETRLGASVVTAGVAGGGFTQGFAGPLMLDDGRRLFLKAAAAGSIAGTMYAQEAVLTAALPAQVPTARLHWGQELAGHQVLCFDAIEGGRMPRLPWRAEELTATLSALTRAAAALSPVPPALAALTTKPFTEAFAGTFDCWAAIADGRLPLPAMMAHLAERLPELIALESRLMAYGAAAGEVIHCDLRVDNVIIDSSGAAWFCDWNWLCQGPAWLDVVTILLSATPDHDAEALFYAHPLSAEAPDDALDALLAGLLGYFTTASERPPVPTSPYIRPHQRYYATLTLDWLVRRRGWRR